MSLVRLENITKSYLGRPVLDGVSLRIEPGERVGLIGRNGTGKSTVFRVITGEIEPDSGVVERMRRLRLACLEQLPKVAEEKTIQDIVMESFPEILELEARLARLEERMAAEGDALLAEYSDAQHAFTAMGGYGFRTRVKQVLQGLGFRPEEFSLPFHALSGGQRTRLRLALALLRDADLLLLDEPENHLDVEAREWLESYLSSCREAVMIISHDRQMLNNATTRIVEVERGQLFDYSGNYAFYQKQKALLREQYQKAYERQEEFIRKEEALIERFRYKNTKARQMQSRLKRLDKLERIEAPPPEADTAAFRLGEVERSGEVVLDVRDAAMAYGDLTLYDGISFTVRRGERVGIVGPNGAGKTTLLRQIAGMHKGTGGAVTLGHKVSVSFFEQNHDNVNRSSDILSEVLSVRPDFTPEQARRFLGRLLFTGEDVFKPVSTLSGGELARVAMAKMILGGANLLLLDEPTNHLDIASREALEGALAAFGGSILLASHDRALVDGLVEKLVILRDGKARVFLGNYADFHRQSGQAEEDPSDKTAEEVLRIRRIEKEREAKKSRAREDRKGQKRLAKVEADIAAMESLLADYTGRFAALDPADFTAAQALTDEYNGLRDDLKALYEEWETLAGEA
ncbi:MAG TPA: ABC-F family ATP-binding cassette domain-containing protein [Candidatus Hydrogenedentes bacterium]|nr:ABC-F family ATP-binding cassette domain-containing protein [Candidatus Hydrogenedentota bacterium]